MEKCMGTLLWMRLVKVPSLADYWSKVERYQNNVTTRDGKL